MASRCSWRPAGGSTSTRNPLARLGLAPPAVMMNGALAIDLAHRRAVPLPPVHGRRRERSILAAFRAVDLEPCVYVDHPRVDVFVGERTVDPSRSPRRPRRDGRASRPREIVRNTPGVDVRDHGPRPGAVPHGRARARGRGRNAPRRLRPVRRAARSRSRRSGCRSGTACVAFCARAGLDPAARARDRRRSERRRAPRRGRSVRSPGRRASHRGAVAPTTWWRHPATAAGRRSSTSSEPLDPRVSARPPRRPTRATATGPTMPHRRAPDRSRC